MTKQDMVASYATRIARVHDYIASHLDDVLALDRLADVAALSRWHFLRVYREMTGETTAGTVRRLRLHRAAVELVQRDTPLAKVVRRVLPSPPTLIATARSTPSISRTYAARPFCTKAPTPNWRGLTSSCTASGYRRADKSPATSRASRNT